jgi:serine/threonine-protein kinase
MASVWRAHDERTGEVVAIKRLHPHLIADVDARERFRREAATMEAIRHPNVVAVRDAVIDGDEPMLVMEFVTGRSLAELGSDGQRLGRPEALAIAAAMSDGLAAVHAHGIVHRDIKPANVLVGDDGLVRLTDFGIAVGSMDATALTADDGVVGTLRYLAPERLEGHPATPATDVWGVGAVLHEMLTGEPAFPEATLASRVEAAAVPIERPGGLPDALWAILARALASDPADRYPDGAAMAVDLHRLPEVPAPLEVPVDPSAPTEVIEVSGAMPARAADPTGVDGGGAIDADAAGGAVGEAPEGDQSGIETPAAGLEGPADAAMLPRKPTRGALVMAAMLGVMTLVLVVGMATARPPGVDPDAPAGAASRSPVATPRDVATPAPVEADGPPADESKPGKGKGNGKGKGKDD